MATIPILQVLAAAEASLHAVTELRKVAEAMLSGPAPAVQGFSVPLWIWRFKPKGTFGIYTEDPALFGIDVNAQGDYEWVVLPALEEFQPPAMAAELEEPADAPHVPVVACVCKSGGDFGPVHVQRLYDQVVKHTTKPFKFVVLTDFEELFATPQFNAIELVEDWPGWWSKIELFRRLPQALYLDLDTTIVSNIDDIVYMEDHTYDVLYALEEFQRPGGRRPAKGVRLGSGVMWWNGDFSYLYKAFADNPEFLMKRYSTLSSWGDQAFIRDHARWWDQLQKRLPGRFVSFKYEVKESGLPPDASVVCYHGKPRPWDLGGQLREHT